MYKLGEVRDGDWVEHVHPRSYELQNGETTSPRLVAGVPRGDREIFEQLSLVLTPPYFVLYILHTSRGEGEEGRYQSPLLNAAELCGMMHHFGRLFATDARFDVWAHSPEDKATVVWDRHNRIFAYGPLERYIAALNDMGYLPGPVSVPDPHQHHFREENDDLARKLLETYDWFHSPLHPQDEQ